MMDGVESIPEPHAMIHDSPIGGRPRSRLPVSSFALFLLAPFLMVGCIVLGLLILAGAIRSPAFLGLNGWILPVWGVGLPAILPLSFLAAVRIGSSLSGVKHDDRDA
jgi:hypothetical protein